MIKRTVTFTIGARDSSEHQNVLLSQAIDHVDMLLHEKYVCDLGLNLLEFKSYNLEDLNEDERN